MTDRIRGRAGQQQRERIMSRDRGLCQPCYARHLIRAGTQVDHIVALANGGTNDDCNLQVICDECHQDKTDEDFGRAVKGCDASGVPRGAAHHWHVADAAGTKP